MKIGIVTLFHMNYNFGGLLQAYALPTALHKYLGVSAEQIDYVYLYTEQNKIKDSLSFGKLIYNTGILLFNKLEEGNFKKRRKAFEQFMAEIPHSEKVYDYNNISDSVERYNAFICGGDQIWNDYNNNRNIKTFTLQFVPSDCKKIAYSPSMAILNARPEFEKIMSDGLNALDAVSVREKKSLSILQPLTNKKIEVVADPVLLLKNSEWADVAISPQKTKKYILCYLLGDSVEQREAVKKFSKKLSLPILTFPHIFLNVVRKCDLFFGDIHDYTSGPREFIGLIKNAEMVITDSFHACVFSMIFKTPFAVFARNKIGENGNMNSRIYDFLEEYHLENQLVTSEELTEMKEIPKIDFTYAHEHWEKRRQESLKYLENALKNNQNGAEQ